MVITRWRAAAIGGLALVLANWLASAAVRAQSPQPSAAPSANLEEVDPIRCWWRTSASAVRVGEPFTLVLTCAVVENATSTVVADQSKLEPAAIQLQPFEVINGQRGPDLHSDQRRFFQYQYTLRLLSEDLFGKDTKIPPLQIDYNLQTRVPQGESVRGRDRMYVLPQESIRVLSLVPVDAGDIRDAPSWTFSDIDSQRFRARVFFVSAGVLATAGALIVLVAVVRVARRRREERAVGRALLSEAAILRGVGRELIAVRSERRRVGWTEALAGRALAALRVVASIALSSHVNQLASRAQKDGQGSQLSIRGGVLWRKKILVSGSATPDTVARELAADSNLRNGRRESLTDLQTALAQFTAAQFGREATFDETALDESLSDAFRALRRLKIDHLWPVMKLRSATQFATGLGSRAWSR